MKHYIVGINRVNQFLYKVCDEKVELYTSDSWKSSIFVSFSELEPDLLWSIEFYE